MKSARRKSSVVPGALALIGLLLALSAWGLTLGPADIGFSEAVHWVGQGLRARLAEDNTRGAIVWELRLPRLLLAALVGASLALAGVVMQGIFRNPMADPFLVGVSGGAALGATAATFWGWSWALAGISATGLFAFAGALGVSFAVYVLAYQAGRVPVLNLLLVGVALGALCQGITALLLRLSPSTDVQRVFFWLMGSFASARWDSLGGLAICLVAALVWLLWRARELDLLLLGEEEAAALGLHVERTKGVLMAVAALLAAVAVSVSGIIGFVGLMVPHMVRLWAGPKHRRLMVLSVPAGAVLLVGSDLVARSLLVSEVPVGIITTLLGVPFFLYLLKRKRGYHFS